jgi:competence protein ComEA
VRRRYPLVMLWGLCAVLWTLVAVDKCGGDDGVVTAIVGRDTVAAVVAAGDREPRRRANTGKDACININRATAAELDALPGVGPVIAARLIDFRERHGPFAKLADIDKVKGIGPATLRKLENRVCF